MLSLVSIEVDHGILKRLLQKNHRKNKHLGAKTLPCYIETCVIVRGVIMRLNCRGIVLSMIYVAKTKVLICGHRTANLRLCFSLCKNQICS